MAPDTILQALQTVAEEQLRAARILDTDGLAAATRRRVELLEALASSAEQPSREALSRHVPTLKRIDERLNRLLRAAQSAFARLNGDSQVYGRDGRMRGGV